MKISLFDNDIVLGNHYCQLNDDDLCVIEEPYINLYIQSNGCNANCSFCEYKENNSIFDIVKYEKFIIELSKQIKIKKISFTGGEPTLNYKEFIKRVKIARKYLKDTFFVVNTNGLHLKDMVDDGAYLLFDSIALSRHHYDDIKNNNILDFVAPNTKFLSKLPNKDIFHFSCNIIKGNIDNEEKIYNYLNWCNIVGISDVGFVSLMTINKYSTENFVDFESISFNNNRFNKTKNWNSENRGCKCSNYLYITDNCNIIKVYNRHLYSKSIGTNFIFDGTNFRQGFKGKVLY